MGRRALLLLVTAGAGACFLPEASIDPSSSSSSSSSGSGGGGSTPGYDWAPPVSGPHKFGASSELDKSIASTGNPGQRHLVNVLGRWYVFYLLGHRLQASYFDAGSTWKPTGDGISLDANYTFDDGRVFGAAVDPTVPGKVHFAADWATGAFHIEAQAPPTESAATPFVFNPATTHAEPSGILVDGAVTTVGADGRAYDFGAFVVKGQPCTSCVTTNDGGGWMQMPLDFSAKTTGQHPRAAVSLTSSPVVAWPLVGALAAARITDGASGWNGSEVPNTLDVKPVARSWAMCSKIVHGSSELAAHLLVQDGPKFAHVFMNGGTWSDFPGGELAAPPNTSSVRELFMVCSADYLYAFTVDDTNAILGARYGANGTEWSKWAVLVPGLSGPGARCFLSGFDQATPGDVGLIWTESTTDCDSKSANTYYSLFVRIG